MQYMSLTKIFKNALLFRMNSLNRANISAGTTISADIRINFIDIAFRYRFNRTFVYTCSACGTIIINFVSHFDYFFELINYKLSTKLP